MRIGITQRVEVVAAYGERRDCLDQAWAELLCGLDFTPVALPNAPQHVEAMARQLDLRGIVFSGGNDLAALEGATNTAPERDRCEEILLEYCAAAGVPIFGVCRGLQAMVQHHGGRLTAIEGHVAQRHAIRATAEAARFGLGDRDATNSFHDFGVAAGDLGDDLVALAHAGDGSVEAIAHRTLPRLAVMWHPERDPNDQRDRELIASFFRSAQENR